MLFRKLVLLGGACTLLWPITVVIGLATGRGCFIMR